MEPGFTFLSGANCRICPVVSVWPLEVADRQTPGGLHLIDDLGV